MRSILTPTAFLVSLFAVAQPGPCDPFDFCFVPSVLPSGNYFFDNCSSGPATTQYVWTYGDGTSSSSVHGEHHYSAPGSYGVCLTAYWGNCSDSTCMLITVGGESPCDNGFDVEMAWNEGANGNVFFNATSNIPGTNFIWYFADGSEGYGDQIEHQFGDTGSYYVCVSGWYYNETSQDSCWTEDCEIIVIADAPCEGFDACFQPVSLPQTGVFLFENCSSPAENAQYLWNFGDGTQPVSSVNADHVFPGPGVYEVCLTAYWGECQETICNMLVVEDFGCAGFMANFGSSVAGNHVQFDNATSGAGPNTMYIWNFGDGTSSLEESPDHTYAAAGTYQVCLTATSQVNGVNGQVFTCTDEYCTTITAFGPGQCSMVPGFFFSQTPNGVQFHNTTTGLGVETSYLWSFGDGSISDATEPFHTYAAPGTYHACLWATTFVQGPNGLLTCQDSTCTDIVTQGSDPCAGLDACYEASQLSSTAFFFDNCSTIPLNATLIWLFGDGSTSNEFAPIHDFPEPGIYTVCLVITWPNGCTREECHPIAVGEDPCAGFNACFVTNHLQQPGRLFFDNCSSNQGNAQFVWSFGDGTASMVTNAEHTYTANGTYTVCLTASYNSCVDSTCTTVVVEDIGDEPCDLVLADFTATTSGLSLQFISTASGLSPQTTFAWTFGDGTEGEGPNPTHTYAGQGVYEVCLHVKSIFASPGQPVVICESDICYVYDVGFGDLCDGLDACFEALPFENGAYLFENCSQTLPIDIPVYYQWNFGDGSTSNEAQPDHAFLPGTYTVCLTVTHGNCVDSTCTTISVGVGPGCDPNYAVDFTWSGQSISATFTATANMPTIGYNWTFGDGMVGYGQTVTQLYEPPGPFEVCVSAWYWNDIQQDTCWAHHCELVDLFATSVAELDGSSIRVFPVPATDQLTIAGLTANTQLRLINADGRLVQSSLVTGTTHSLNVSGLAKGGYVLRLATDHGNIHRKVIVE